MIRTGPGAAAAIAAAAALAIGTAALSRGTWAVGGSDSACYALMADAFASGRLQPTSTLAGAPWPDPSLTLAPAGFIPSPSRPGAASPICAPGFSLFLAPLVLVASTPILLFQVVQPMNDVFVSALWLGAVVALAGKPEGLPPHEPSRWGKPSGSAPSEPSRRGRPSGLPPSEPSSGGKPSGLPGNLWLGGLLVGAALLTRPNLLPAALVVAAWVFASGRAVDLTSPWKGGVTALAAFGLAVAPFGLTVLALNHALYGGAFRTGYGDASGMFAWSSVPLNAASHLKAVFETQLGLPLLGLAAPFVLRDVRRPAALAMLVAGAVILCYLPYSPFPEWWYLRFLLPAVVLLMPLAAAAATMLAGRRAGPAKAGLYIAVAILGIYQIRTAVERQAFDLQRLESRYRHVAEAMLDHLPPSTVAISVWDSGSVRFHAGREAVMWDAMDPAWLDRAVTWLLGQGRPSVVVVERWEEPLFRSRFGARSSIGALDWPPRIDVDGLVRIYDPADRVRYLSGQRVETRIVAPRR